MKRDTRREVPRNRHQSAGRYTEREIAAAIGVRSGPVTVTHAIDLYNALLCWLGLPFDVPIKGVRKSMNMLALIVGAMANVPARAVEAAGWVVRELTPQLRPVPHQQTGKMVHFGGDELLSGEGYLSWTVFGWCLALRGLVGRTEPICREACALIVEWLNRQAALLALVAAPGICRNPNGSIGYQWLVARCAGLRSLVAMLRWPGSTAAVWGLLGGPISAWQGKVPILAEAIADLFPILLGGGLDVDRSDDGEGAWRSSTGNLQRLLGDTRTAIDLEVRQYADGARLSMLLGPGAGGSTAGMRAVLVQGPECPITEDDAQRQLDIGGPIRSGDVVAAFPEPVERERGDQAGDGWLLQRFRDPHLPATELYVCTDGPGREGKRVELELPSETPVLMVRTTQDAPPEWRIAA